MLKSYFSNSAVGMTKEAYFEMCDALGNEPIEEEIPIEYSDFPVEVQEAIGVYHRLRDEWDTMNGNYMGKSFVGLRDVLDILEVEFVDRKMVLDWIGVIDATRSETIANAKPKVKK